MSVMFVSRASAQEAVSSPGRRRVAPGSHSRKSSTRGVRASGAGLGYRRANYCDRFEYSDGGRSRSEPGHKPQPRHITKSGERNTEELLRNLPIANANGVPVSNNENGSNTAVGGATIALRGFDSEGRPLSCSMGDASRLTPWVTTVASASGSCLWI